LAKLKKVIFDNELFYALVETDELSVYARAEDFNRYFSGSIRELEDAVEIVDLNGLLRASRERRLGFEKIFRYMTER